MATRPADFSCPTTAAHGPASRPHSAALGALHGPQQAAGENAGFVWSWQAGAFFPAPPGQAGPQHTAGLGFLVRVGGECRCQEA